MSMSIFFGMHRGGNKQTYKGKIIGKWNPIDIIPTMTLTRQEVDHIALLARLELSKEEKERYQQQLSDILDYVAQLQKLDTSNISPTSGVLPPSSPLRDDCVEKGLDTQRALENAPSVEADQFKVPPVLE